jgi:hypothetical protein
MPESVDPLQKDCEYIHHMESRRKTKTMNKSEERNSKVCLETESIPICALGWCEDTIQYLAPMPSKPDKIKKTKVKVTRRDPFSNVNDAIQVLGNLAWRQRASEQNFGEILEIAVKDQVNSPPHPPPQQNC